MTICALVQSLRHGHVSVLGNNTIIKPPGQHESSTMNGQEAFRRIANQLKAAGGGGGPLPGAPKGLFAGSGLLIALVAGGFALNASLFNGAAISLSN